MELAIGDAANGLCGGMALATNERLLRHEPPPPDRKPPAPATPLVAQIVRRHRVRRAIDAGRPAALGLVHAVSADPRRLIGNHQVVAHGYELEASAGRVSLAIYDPNHPDDDAIRLRITLAGPHGPVSFEYVAGEPPVLGLVALGARPSG